MKTALPLIACLTLAACAAPVAPTLNGSNRQPINSAETIRMFKQGAPTTQAPAPRAAMPEVFRYYFPVGGYTLDLSAREKATLIQRARSAEKVIVRARTDAKVSSGDDLLTARRRAENARLLLTDGGVEPQKITANYQSGGDYLDDNSTPEGRARNRRVEIEMIGRKPS